MESGSKPPALAIAITGLIVSAALVVTPALGGAGKSVEVKRVVDGDTVKVDFDKGGARTLGLAGVDAPEGGECFAKAAKRKLSKLLPKGAELIVKGGSEQVEILAGRKSINRAMVRGGFARAGKASGKLGKRLASDEAKAQKRGKGLWSACADGGDGGDDGDDDTSLPGPGDSQPDDVTGQAAIDQMTTALSDLALRRLVNQGTLSDEYHLHLCSDKRFRYMLATTNADPDFSFFSRTEKFGEPWTVTEALIRPSTGYRGAVVTGTFTTQRTDGATGAINEPVSTTIEEQNGTVYWDGEASEAFAGAATCDPF